MHPSILQTTVRVLALGILVGLPLSLAHGQSNVSESTASESTPATATLQPGDMVRLRIWREPDLSGDYPVNEAGEVVLPKLGPLTVSEISGDSLQHMLVASYARFLRQPSIDVILLRRVSVQGEVRSPGVFQVDPTMTVSSVLALAGGPSSDGNTNRIELRRDGQQIEVKLAPETQLLESPLRSGDQLWVPKRSWWSRNTAVIASTLTAVGIVVGAAITR